MRLRKKPWADQLVASNRDIGLNLDDVDSLPTFNCLEIGSGCGLFLINMAKKNPTSNFLGVEVAYNAFSLAIKKYVNTEDKPSNLHFINAPFEKIYPYIEKESLDYIFLNFSDPWPKKRHNKRRLTYPTNLELYYSLLKKGGKVLFKTDNDVLYEDSKEYFKEFSKFEYIFIDDYKVEENLFDEINEYESKFRSKGQSIHRIEGVKR